MRGATNGAYTVLPAGLSWTPQILGSRRNHPGTANYVETSTRLVARDSKSHVVALN